MRVFRGPDVAGTIEAIYVAATSGAPMRGVAEAALVVGCGISGDRNFRDDGAVHDQQITLIAAEAVARFNQQTGLEIGPDEPRRNVVTRGIELNELVGRQFRIGETTLTGLELCEPCATLGQRLATPAVTAAQVVSAFAHRAGLRARIDIGGRIAAGDVVGPLTSPLNRVEL